MGPSTFHRMVFCTVVAVLLVSELFAQTTQGGIVGAIRDEKGADIVSAKNHNWRRGGH